MDLGLGFDDSDFERKQKTTAGTKTSYNAKVCTSLVSMAHTKLRSVAELHGLMICHAIVTKCYRFGVLHGIH